MIRVISRGVLIVALLTAFAGFAAAETGGTPVNVCGRMTEYRAPTQTQPGSITVAGEQFAISSDAKQNVSSSATVGSDVCLTGTWFASQTVGRNLTELTVTPRTATPTGASGPVSLPSTTTAPSAAASDTQTGALLVLALALAGLALIFLARLRKQPTGA